MVFPTLDGAARPLGLSPIGAVHLDPPGRRRRRRRRRLGAEKPPKHRRPAEALGFRNIAGFSHKGGKAGIGHSGRLKPERREIDRTPGPLAILWQFRLVGADKAASTAKHDAFRRNAHPPLGLNGHRDRIGAIAVRRAAGHCVLLIRAQSEWLGYRTQAYHLFAPYWHRVDQHCRARMRIAGEILAREASAGGTVIARCLLARRRGVNESPRHGLGIRRSICTNFGRYRFPPLNSPLCVDKRGSVLSLRPSLS